MEQWTKGYRLHDWMQGRPGRLIFSAPVVSQSWYRNHGITIMVSQSWYRNHGIAIMVGHLQ